MDPCYICFAKLIVASFSCILLIHMFLLCSYTDLDRGKGVWEGRPVGHGNLVNLFRTQAAPHLYSRSFVLCHVYPIVYVFLLYHSCILKCRINNNNNNKGGQRIKN